MQIVHNGAAKLDALRARQAFRFHFRNETAIGLKAQFNHGAGSDAALVLTPTTALQAGAFLSSSDVGDVVPLARAKIVPSTKPGTPGKGNFARSGEIELRGGRLLFVTQPHGDERITYRVDLQSGNMSRSSPVAPVEIYSEWTIQDDAATLHEHKRTPPEPTESVVVAVG